MLLAIPGLVMLTVLAVASARLGGYQPAIADQPTVASRQLRFADQEDGAIRVTDAATGQTIAQVAQGGDGFLRATMRGLANARKQRGSGPETPFLLAAHSDGALTLRDPVTGRVLDLAAFGPTNEAAFARFLPAAPPARPL